MTHASVFNGSSEVRFTGQLDGRVLVSLRCPGPARLEATSVPAEQLRAALDEVAPAGSYTRTTSPDLMDGGVTSALVEEEAEAAYTRTDEEASLRLAAEQIAEAQAEATAAVTAKEKAEQERDEARRERDNLRAQLEADSDVNYLLREDRDAWKRKAAEQPRPLTPDDITDEMVERAFTEWEPGVDCMAGPDDSVNGRLRAKMRRTIAAALTPPPAEDPEVVAIVEVLGDFAVADEHTGKRDDMALSRMMHRRGVRVTGADS